MKPSRIAAKVKGLRADIKGLRREMKEIDRRHQVEIEAVEKAATLATRTSEKASENLAAAQKDYNTTHNDRVPRDEAESRFKGFSERGDRLEAMIGSSHKELAEKIQGLSESRSGGAGAQQREQYIEGRRSTTLALIVLGCSLFVSIIVGFASIGVSLFVAFRVHS